MPTASLLQCGDKFNNWTFVKEVERQNNKSYGLFECGCGKQKEVYIPNVKNGKSKSCGCVMKKENSQRFRKNFPVGTVFGYLTVIGESVKPEGKTSRYLPCRCVCGKELLAHTAKLISGKKDSCGCKTLDKFREKKNVKIDIGAKYNRLTILREVDPIVKNDKGHLKRYVECLCDCGVVKVIELREVTLGGTKSCGCFKTEQTIKLNTTHGLSKTSTYDIWYGIKARCFNPNNNAYKYYGERGITMCERWKESFENFIEDMGVRPSEEYSIDRIDTNGNYEPDNCKWATRIAQARNKSSNHLVTYGSKTKTFAEWVEIFGIDYKTLWGKCNRNNWDTDAIFDEIINF